MLLVSNISVFAEENNIKNLKSETNPYSGAIVGYNASEKKEIFGDLNQNEIDAILNSIAKEVAKPGVNYNTRNIAQNYDAIDFSKLFIKTLDESHNSAFINNDNSSNAPIYKSSSFSKRDRKSVV